jgi:lactoylglutathione lyase
VEAWLDQYCINVTDLERSVAFYEAIGLQDIGRTALPEAKIDEAIVANPDKGGRIQLAVWHERSGPIDHGNALWKLYIKTNDVDRMYAEAMAFGCESVTAPFVTDRWPTKIAFVHDPDGYLVEFVQFLEGVGDDQTTRAWASQYCINVSDIEATIRFYELVGLEVESRTELDTAREAIMSNTSRRGGRVQLAQQLDQAGPIDMGTAFWKLYVYTDDVAGLHDKLVGAGYQSIRDPARTPRWPTTISFVADPDNYTVELVQRHES